MTGRMSTIAALSVLLLVALGAFAALGIWVTHHPLSRLDMLGAAMRGVNVPLAIVLTQSGYGVALTGLGILTTVGALLLGASVRIPLALLVSQVLSQAVVNIVKGYFARPRPDAWLVRHEAGFAYPSGHATTAVVFYGGWLVVLVMSSLPLPVRAMGAVVIGVWAAGICWSRVALGAHYPTDVAGGVLFGLAWLCGSILVAVAAGAGLFARHA